MDLFVARQPIFDSSWNVVGYELLYRSGEFVQAYNGQDGNVATAKVVAASFFSSDCEQITAGKPAFINFPRQILLGDLSLFLPPGKVVIEILEDIEPDSEVVDRCVELKANGYRLALDDFVFSAARNPLAQLADIIKVDFRGTTAPEREIIAKEFGRTCSLLAEKVETSEEAEVARKLGFRLFQGYHWGRPRTLKARHVPSLKANLIQLLRATQSPEINYNRVAEVIVKEPGLTYAFLSYLNSAAFTFTGSGNNVTQGLVYLGESHIRRWARVLALADLGATQPPEFVVTSLVRGRVCELLAPAIGLADRSDDAYLLGMLSLLDSILGKSMIEVLSALGLPDELKMILHRRDVSDSPLATLLQVAISYENGDWDEVARAISLLQLREAVVATAYVRAAEWATTQCSFLGRPATTSPLTP